MRDLWAEDGRLRWTFCIHPARTTCLSYRILQDGYCDAPKYMQGRLTRGGRVVRSSLTIALPYVQSCSHVLLDEEKRRSYLRKFRRPHLENVQRTMLAKQVNMACRKVAICPHCGEVNGVVKKVGALKILHEKYRSKKMLEERKRWEKTFTNAISEMKEILPHLSKAHDDLNPLRVFNLFKQITAADCELLGLDPAVGRPEEFIWQYLSVPPVCIRPSVPQESAT